MERLPLFLDVKGKRCVVVGGGEVALRKATLLARAGAKLHVVAPELGDEMQRCARGSQRLFARPNFNLAV